MHAQIYNYTAWSLMPKVILPVFNNSQFFVLCSLLPASQLVGEHFRLQVFINNKTLLLAINIFKAFYSSMELAQIKNDMLSCQNVYYKYEGEGNDIPVAKEEQVIKLLH